MSQISGRRHLPRPVPPTSIVGVVVTEATLAVEIDGRNSYCALRVTPNSTRLVGKIRKPDTLGSATRPRM
ncbi:hypothetical protein CH289_16195 [Rhodococcus sp. RS1C4]|nr:hypothetical protein CH289_16195 [Rhodococcus sp. RS1C4]OZD65108.1 hypothetical protein CH263_13265 [Rhodococcus sp. 06-1059B-a]